MSELGKVRDTYSPEKLEDIKNQLELYLVAHRDDILEFQRTESAFWGKPIPLPDAVKMFILDKRTIDMRAEMTDQLSAMKAEIARDLDDTSRRRTAAMEWARQNGKYWRSLRLMAIILVFHERQNHFLTLLQRS